MKIKAEQIVLVEVDSIVVNPKNNNTHPREQIEHLKKIIRYSGFRNPLTISTRTGFLNCGEARLIAAKELEMKQVPVMFQEFDDEAQEYAHMTADNAVQQQSIIDFKKVNETFPDFGPDFNVDMLGIKNFTLDISDKTTALDEWDGMPEYDQGDKTSFRHVIVHFETQDDAKEFFSIIGQNDTGKTKSIWFPEQVKMDTESKRYG